MVNWCCEISSTTHPVMPRRGRVPHPAERSAHRSGRAAVRRTMGYRGVLRSLKTRWYNFEDNHLKALERIDTVMAVLAVAFIWCLKTGEYQLDNGQIPLKQLEGRKAKLIIVFRCGFDHLKHQLLTFLSLIIETKLLSCTETQEINFYSQQATKNTLHVELLHNFK